MITLLINRSGLLGFVNEYFMTNTGELLEFINDYDSPCIIIS